ncbi:MAG: metallophosphoesterase family protein [Gammaproteobacteria bacterium]
MKIWFKRSLTLLLALVMFYAVARFIDVYTGSIIDGARDPYLQMPTPHSVVVRWQTTDDAIGSVHFGTSPGQLDTSISEPEATSLHSIQLDGLMPDTRYYYAVASSDAQRQNPDYDSTAGRWFQTLPRAGSARPARLWVIGDSGDPGSVVNNVRDSAMRWIAEHPRPGYPDFDVWLALGDIAYRSGTDEQFQASLFDTFGDQLKNHALWPVYGNHDDRRWTYFRVFTLPEQGEAGGAASATENYYSFDYADLHVVVLDSQDSGREVDDDMLLWLRRDLADNKSRWLIAAFHHPPYSKGSHNSDNEGDSGGRMQDMREHALPILEAAGVDLVLSGHSHMYERSYLIDCHYGSSDSFGQSNIVSDGINHHNTDYIKTAGKQPHAGTVYVVAGSSSKVDQAPINHPALPVSMLEAGSLVIDVDGYQLTSRFINDKGEVRDVFTIRKDVDYRSDYAGCGLKD